ncbi:hypothetical protein CXB51_022909 [Gossypium anomalum]|uniref:Uncharacterized protein n=1 Tax=Gossypium anomalum TaxID=47600 RepID=A0A8J5Y740_9ROSI|nr:hypothetical protein CXB51_022909 [Gossypium anomalum]
MALSLTISNGTSSSSNSNGGPILPNKQLPFGLPHRRNVLFPISPRTFHLTSAAKKFSSRTGRFDSKNRRSNLTTKEQDEEQELKRTGEIEESNIAVGVGLEDVGGSSSEISADGKPFPDLPGLQPDLWEGPKWDVLGFLVQYLWAFGIVFAEGEQNAAPRLARLDFVLTKCEDVVPEFGETWKLFYYLLDSFMDYSKGGLRSRWERTMAFQNSLLSMEQLIACGIAVATYNEGATDFKETPAYKESIQSQELLEQPDASNSDVFESNPTEVAPSLE